MILHRPAARHRAAADTAGTAQPPPPWFLPHGRSNADGLHPLHQLHPKPGLLPPAHLCRQTPRRRRGPRPGRWRRTTSARPRRTPRRSRARGLGTPRWAGAHPPAARGTCCPGWGRVGGAAGGSLCARRSVGGRAAGGCRVGQRCAATNTTPGEGSRRGRSCSSQRALRTRRTAMHTLVPVLL